MLSDSVLLVSRSTNDVLSCIWAFPSLLLLLFTSISSLNFIGVRPFTGDLKLLLGELKFMFGELFGEFRLSAVFLLGDLDLLGEVLDLLGDLFTGDFFEGVLFDGEVFLLGDLLGDLRLTGDPRPTGDLLLTGDFGFPSDFRTSLTFCECLWIEPTSELRRVFFTLFPAFGPFGSLFDLELDDFPATVVSPALPSSFDEF